MLALPDVTLIAVWGVGSADTHLITAALDYSSKDIHFARVVLLSPTPPKLSSIEHVYIPAMSGDEWTLFYREMHRYVDTPYALTVHADGYVINPNAWQQHFLKYDYIGAPWPDELLAEGRSKLAPHGLKQTPGYRVGNSGFSLRSAKFMREVSTLPAVSGLADDIYMCQAMGPYLESKGVWFAPESVAYDFSIESPVDDSALKSFGFHGRRTEKTRALCTQLQEYEKLQTL